MPQSLSPKAPLTTPADRPAPLSVPLAAANEMVALT
jgi:hypothetical protein